MKRLLSQLGALLLLMGVAATAHAGEVIDRLVASVDNVPILQSDWEMGVGFEALEAGKPLGAFGPEERRAVLERLVDQQLLRAQMGDDTIAAADEREIEKAVAQLRSQYPEAKTDEQWHELLASYGLDEKELHEKVARQLQVLRFVNLRLRPDTGVTRADVETYYTNTLVPEVEKRGATADKLNDVYPKIVEILRQQKIDALLSSWLKDLRAQSDIQVAPDVSSPVQGAETAAASGGD